VSSITKLSESAGIFGPIVLILLISLGILLSPVPSVIFIITAGYLYGAWEGALYSYLGHLLAAIAAFMVFRKFERKEESRRYIRYRKLIHKNKKILYLLYAVPIIPISVITFITATSRIRWKEFLKIIMVSFAPTVLLFSFFGERIGNRNLLEIGIWIVGIAIIGIIIFEVIRHNKKRMMNGYPSSLKIPRPKRRFKYLRFE
jgi:uncharacterized membrane protein YdjX (TVP38/TMEM64 family)